MDLFAVALTMLSLTATTPTGVELELLIDTTSPLPGSAEEEVWFLDGPAPVPCGAGVLLEVVKTSSAPMGLAYYVDAHALQVVVHENSVVGGTAIRFEEVSHFRCAEPGRSVYRRRGSTFRVGNMPTSTSIFAESCVSGPDSRAPPGYRLAVLDSSVL